MSVIMGKLAVVNGVSTLRSWSANVSAAIAQYYASGMDGMSAAVDGNTDWSGQYAAYGGLPVALPGEAFSFVGSKNGAAGIAGTAIVESIEVSCNIEEASPIEHTVSFAANGVLGKSDATAVSDAVVPDAPPSKGCKVEIADAADSPSYAEISDVRSYSLSITAANGAYNSSGTAGQTRRVAGNTAASLSIAVYSDDLTALPEENDVQFVRLYVSATTFWLLQAVKFTDQSDILYDRSSNTPVGFTVNGVFIGAYDIEGTQTQGTLTKPGGAAFWPPA